MTEKPAIFTAILLEYRAGLKGELAGQISGDPTFEWR